MKEMTILHRMGEGGKCLIGMVHCLPLPGTLGHGGDMEKIYENGADRRAHIRGRGL